MRIRHIVFAVVLLVLVFGVGRLSTAGPSVPSGSLDSPGPPGSTSLYTLEDIYDRLDTGAEATKSTFTEPASGPTVGTGHTLDEVYELIGFRASVPKTGQTLTVPINPAPTGSDGDLQKGVAWPSPRFITSTANIVTDTLTGLIWLKNANCPAFFAGDSTGQNYRSWSDALVAANSLASGYCGLVDGSSAGDWRLPNVRELQSLMDYSQIDPALPSGHPFNIVTDCHYWSSSTYAGSTAHAWYVYPYRGSIIQESKTVAKCVWPVRDGQRDALEGLP